MNIKSLIKSLSPPLFIKIYIFIKYLFINNIFYHFFNYKKYIPTKSNSVLLIEFHSFHGEILPGITKYLLDLNFNVDVYIKNITVKRNMHSRNDIGLFSYFSGNNKVSIFFLPENKMNYLLRSPAALKYKHIIISTYGDNTDKVNLYGVNLYNLKPLCMVHDVSCVSTDYSKTNKIFAPVKMEYINRKPIPPISIHFFGNFNKKNKLPITTFIALNSKDITIRNLYLLFRACDKLYQNNIKNFIVKIIGNGIPIPEKYIDNFKILGYLDFLNMWNEISTSDFVLGLIDQTSIHYTNKVSGSYNLSYGILKPIILHRIFSYVSGFNDNNSILYDDNEELYKAMIKCIDMTNDDYLSILNNLEETEKKLYKNSLDNFKIMLESELDFQYLT